MDAAGGVTNPLPYGRLIVPVIYGPTASGKSALAMRLARANSAIEIISADSRQIYRGLDIGTAKPTREELRDVRHHLIDIIDPSERFSAGEYARRAHAAIELVVARGGVPLVTGGTGFYIRALFEGLAAPRVDPAIHRDLAERLAREGNEALYRELEEIDPAAARVHSPANHARTLRALACIRATGRLYSSFFETAEPSRRDISPVQLVLQPPRDELYERINRRVMAMMREGLLEEVITLRASGYTALSPAMKTVGYAELLQHLDGALSLEDAVAHVQQSTRRYAKRQYTWINSMQDDLFRLTGSDDDTVLGSWIAAWGREQKRGGP